jgi:fatty acid desaturase
MTEQGQRADKTVSWATVLVLAGLVFFVIGLVMRAPAVWVFVLALLGAGAVTQLVASRRH